MVSDKKSNKKNKGLQDVISKVVSIGVGAAFMTEDAVKTILNDLPLPKDIVSGLIQNAKGAKEEFSTQIREEMKNHLDKINPNKLRLKFSYLSFKILKKKKDPSKKIR